MTTDALPKTVSAAQLADLLGVSGRRVAQLAQEGAIPKNARGVYPLPDAVHAYVAYVKANPDGRPRKMQGLEAEKVRLTRAQAELAELKSAQARGDLLDAQAVHARWVSTVTALRAALLAVPARIAAQAGLDRAAAALLDAEMRAAMDQIATAGEEESMSAAETDDSPSPAPTPAESPSTPETGAQTSSDDDPDVEAMLA